MGKGEKIILSIGVSLFFVGGASIDSPNQIIPTIMVLAGLILMASVGVRYAG